MTTTIPRMRFPAQALAELKQADPQTPVTLNMIRSLIRRGTIPCIEVWRGKLLNYDDLLDYLAAAPAVPPAHYRRNTAYPRMKGRTDTQCTSHFTPQSEILCFNMAILPLDR